MDGNIGLCGRQHFPRYSTFIRRMQSSGFNRSLSIMLLAKCMYLLEANIGTPIKILLIVVNMNKATYILGVQ